MDWIAIGLKLVVVAAVAAFVYWVYHSIDRALEDHYVEPVKLVYEKNLSAERTLRTSAEGANAQLQGQLAAVSKDVMACNQSVKDLATVSQSAVDVSKGALKVAEERERKSATKIDSLEAQARAANTNGDFCEKARKGNDILNDLSRDLRVREPGK